MKQTLLHNWNVFRFLRLALGIAILVQGITTRDYLFSFAGLLFSVLALFNAGCCAGSNCYPSETKKTTASTKDITYEEVV